MLHEGLGSMSLWRDFPERLAAATGCRVLIYSRHGYGGSSLLTAPRNADYMHEEARVWLPQILRQLGVRRPVLFGHSDGASIALIHAALPGAELSGLILLAPHVMVEDLTVAAIEQARDAFRTTDLRKRLARHHRDVESTFRGWNDIWLHPAFRGWNIEALLGAVRCPVLAIQGRDDEYGTLAQLEILRRAVPGTAVQVLEDCRHSPHRDQPVAVLTASREFIAALHAA
ncbi:MAG: alpha/beta hydrolase [Steroidobacteraceae bacterium]|jgi:pimeloyl-ACP methyl ester carboxylesterase